MDTAPPLPAPFVFSQASLQDYLDCPRRFDLRYLRRLAWPAVDSEPALELERRMDEGQQFHRLVRQHLLGLPIERLTPLASSPNLRRWWENYLTASPSLNGYTRYTEHLLTAPVGKTSLHRLIARYDLIARTPDGRFIIFDWKTYTRRPRDEQMAARLQTRLYRALLVRAGAYLNGGQPIIPERVEMVYWYAEYPQQPARFPYSLQQYQRDWAALEKLTDEIASARDFPPTEDESRCALCPYRSYCARGIRAGMAEPDEDDWREPDIRFEQIQEIAF